MIELPDWPIAQRKRMALRSSRFAEAFAAEPWIGSERTQRQVLEALLNLYFMHANGIGTPSRQNTNCCLFSMRGANTYPQDDAVGAGRCFGTRCPTPFQTLSNQIA